jgi:hypothetical protein
LVGGSIPEKYLPYMHLEHNKSHTNCSDSEYDSPKHKPVPRRQISCYISSEMLYHFYVTLNEYGTFNMHFNIHISICIVYPDHEDALETYSLYLWHHFCGLPLLQLKITLSLTSHIIHLCLVTYWNC